MSEVERDVSAEAEAPRATQKLGADSGPSEPAARRAETQKLADPQERRSRAVVPVPHLGLTREEMNWAAMAHASILVTLLLGISTGGLAAILGPLIPALIWYVYRDKSEYVVEQARQATIFQLAGIIALLALATVGAVLVAIGWAVSAVMLIVLIGLLLLPVMLVATLLWAAVVVALPVAQVVYGCFAAVETYHGRPFRYRWIADLIDRYQAQAG
jgi:uncharacterized Tic20 family protein